ncbi:response regulator [Nocardia sp. ET3-3]|uniref:Response regulator n=1 Tax=Nocardia terrae TaxID=2675851 RepID=A0A7K1UUX1_9NOCA|nr:response regulator [Nocardia terrae]MVU78082.1 response regulator [Nocardia terrae]
MNTHQLSITRAPQPPIPPSHPAPASRVLVVERHATTAEMALLVLAAAGYDALHAGSGAQALTLTPQWHPDLILLDILLPDLSGIDVCLRLCQTSSAPVMIVTAETEPAIIDLALTAGACDYLPKPFRTADLITRIGTRLGR